LPCDRRGAVLITNVVSSEEELDRRRKIIAGPLLNWIKDNKSKFIALVIFILYLIAAIVVGPDGNWIRVFGFMVLPLVCILFGDVMGGYIGTSSLMGPWINKASPGCLIVLLGWVLLFSPIIVMIFNLFGKK